MSRTLLIVAAMIGLSTAATLAAEPPRILDQFRGDGTGLSPKASPPLTWSTTENVLWKTPLANWSNGSPCVAGDRIFVLAEPFDLVCLDRDSGKLLWTKSNPLDSVLDEKQKAMAADLKPLAEQLRKRIAETKRQRQQLARELAELDAAATQPDANAADLAERSRRIKAAAEAQAAELAGLEAKLADSTVYELAPTNEVNGYASATPAADESSVYAVFGNGAAVCYDFNGNRRWGRFAGKTPLSDGHSASPVLAMRDDIHMILLVHVNNLTALDPQTGAVLWEAPDTRPGFGTPVVTRVGTLARDGDQFKVDYRDATPVAVTANGDVVKLDGKVLARNVSTVSYCSPIASPGLAYFVQNISKGHGGGHAVAMFLDPDGKLVTRQLWQTKPARDRYYASPVLDVERKAIYAVNQAGTFSVIKPDTGEVAAESRLDLGKGITFPSIVQAGEHLLVSSDNGSTAVLTRWPEVKVVRINKLAPFRSTPTASGDRLYIRTLDGLYCIGPKR